MIIGDANFLRKSIKNKAFIKDLCLKLRI